MQDHELYQHLLGLTPPWRVDSVELDAAHEQILVRVAHGEGELFGCPECDRQLACYDHSEERRWRHLDSCQYQTLLVARPPRVECPEHGARQANVPRAEPGSRFTLLFERLAIDALLATQTVTGAMALLGTKWDQTWGLLRRAVERGRSRKQAGPVPRIGINEKAFSKGQSYVTLLCDLDNSTVEAISDGNDAQSGRECFEQLTEDQRDSVEAVAMDMSAAYVKAAEQSLPEAQIVHDRFHIMQLATGAVDQVRRCEHRELKKQGDHRLAKTKYMWLKSTEDLTEKQEAKLEEVYSIQLKTGKAWGYKEMLRDLWSHAPPEEAIDYSCDWCKRVIHTKLEPLKRVARTIKQRLGNVVSFCTHGVTNAVAEGINSKIMAIKRRVGGYRNRRNFKHAILFHCGGLDLYPR